MSSDSSAPSKSQGNKNTKTINKNRNIPHSSSGESAGQQTSRGSKGSQKSVRSILARQKTELLGPPTHKPSVTGDTYHNEDSHKGTGNTQNSTAPTVITAVLKELRDDVVHSSSRQQSGPVSLINGDRAIAVIGGDNVYVQNKSKFIPVPREKVLSIQHDQQFWAYQASKPEEHSPLDTAVLLQKVFTPLSSISFGLLGGVALLQLTLVHHLLKGVSDQDVGFFLQSYSRFAELTPLLFYILLAVCIVSVLDRVPVRQGNIVCQQPWLVVAVYALTLILTLSCASYDSMIALYPQNKTLFQDQMKVQEFVSEWQLFNTLRCFFAILGWVLFSLTSPPDLLYEQLLEIKEYEQRKLPSPTLSRNFLH